MKQIISAYLLLSLLILTPIAFAKEEESELQETSFSNNIPTQAQKKIEQQKKKEEDLARKGLAKKQKVTERVASIEAKTRERLEERKAKVEARVASKEAKINEKIEDRKERLEERREKIASREAAFKAKVEQFKSKQKAVITKRLNENLVNLNNKKTEQMSNHLSKMTEILGKVESKVTEATNNGKDVGSAKEAIEKAKLAISEAQSTVETQSTEDYNIDISTEAKVKNDATSVRQKLAADLKATQEKVVEARKALGDAISISVSTLGGQNGTK